MELYSSFIKEREGLAAPRRLELNGRWQCVSPLQVLDCGLLHDVAERAFLVRGLFLQAGLELWAHADGNNLSDRGS